MRRHEYARRVASLLKRSSQNNLPLVVLFEAYEQQLLAADSLVREINRLEPAERSMAERVRYSRNELERKNFNNRQTSLAQLERGQTALQKLQNEHELLRDNLKLMNQKLTKMNERLIGLQEDMDSWLDERELEIRLASTATTDP